MKKFLLIALSAICVANTVHGYDVYVTCMETNTVLANPTTGCTRSVNTITCGGVNYYDCTSCEEGYTLGEATVTDPGNSSVTYTYGTCTKDFSGNPIPVTECPDDCPSTTEWTATTLNREAICVGSILARSCSYRCIKGYYQGTLICTQCPVSEYGVRGTTAAAGATSQEECYIPAGTAFSDDSGSGILTSDCYYTE